MSRGKLGAEGSKEYEVGQKGLYLPAASLEEVWCGGG